MNEILNIGKEIEDLKLNNENFSHACYEYLKNKSIKVDIHELEDFIAKWSLETKVLPEQVNVYNGFGQPPITLFNNGHFVVDLYFWQTLDTSIHSHSFSGAFQVLYGESRHEVFKVTKDEEFFDDIFLSNLECIVDETLVTNDIREIKRGLEFSHRVLHEHNPTVTLCIRTVNDKSPQWHHFDNGLSIQKRSPEASDIKRLSIFDYLITRNPKQGRDYLDRLMNEFSPSLIMNLYEELSYDQMGLQESSVEIFFEAVVDRFGDTKWFKRYMDFFN
ncbi:hypothetical protein [Halobacteriovorax sp. YZS-1-1]|uniref:hypothetical protein n=1 Tax=unclassified Halobacteriovorax TaxID=2639665 RepID=UPI00399A4F92